MKTSIINKKIIITLSSIISFIAILYIIFLIVGNDIIFPAPHNSFLAFIKLLGNSSTYKIILSTFIRLVITLVISFIIGGMLGLLAGRYKGLAIFLKPWMTVIRSIPLASIIVIIMIILGFAKSPYIIASLMLIPIIYEAFKNGIINLDQDLMQVWKLDGNFNFKVFRLIIFPMAKPFIKTAFIQSVGLGVKVLIMAEFICFTPNSIGKELGSAANNLEYANVFAWSLIAIFFVLIVEALPHFVCSIVDYLEKRRRIESGLYKN